MHIIVVTGSKEDLIRFKEEIIQLEDSRKDDMFIIPGSFEERVRAAEHRIRKEAEKRILNENIIKELSERLDKLNIIISHFERRRDANGEEFRRDYMDAFVRERDEVIRHIENHNLISKRQG